MFIENNVAIFGYCNDRTLKWDNESFCINPVLKDFNFMRVLDPVTAYNELRMFIGGVLTNPEKDVDQVSMEYRYRQKGFDEKYGFRKRPKS